MLNQAETNGSLLQPVDVLRQQLREQLRLGRIDLARVEKFNNEEVTDKPLPPSREIKDDCAELADQIIKVVIIRKNYKEQLGSCYAEMGEYGGSWNSTMLRDEVLQSKINSLNKGIERATRKIKMLKSKYNLLKAGIKTHTETSPWLV